MADLPPLRVPRHPLDTIGPAFRLLRRAGKPLFKAYLKYLAPPLLVAGLGVGFFYGEMLSDVTSAASGSAPSALDAWSVLAVGVGGVAFFAVFALATLMAAVWARRLADGELLDDRALWDEARPFLGTTLRLWLLVGGLSIGAMVAIGVLMLVPVVGALALLVLGALGLLAYGALMLAPQAMVSERTGAWASLVRGWDLLEGVRWPTLALVLILFVISTMLSYAVMIPLAIVAGIVMAMGVTGSGLASAGAMGGAFGFVMMPISFLPQILFYAVAAVLYYARVEATEFVGLHREVGSLMTTFDGPPAPPAPAAWDDSAASVDHGAFGAAPLDEAASPFGPTSTEEPAASTPPPLPSALDPSDRWRPSAASEPATSEPAAPSDDDPLARWRSGSASQAPTVPPRPDDAP